MSHIEPAWSQAVSDVAVVLSGGKPPRINTLKVVPK